MNVVRYITIFIILTTIGILYDRYVKKFFPDEELDKHNLVRKYLLNEGESLTGKPILWLHIEVVARLLAWDEARNSDGAQRRQAAGLAIQSKAE